MSASRQIVVLLLTAVFGGQAAATDATGSEDQAAALLERAGARLADAPYSFRFELHDGRGSGEPLSLSGEAFVEPLDDGSSRFRIEATRSGGGSPPGALLVVDDGESVQVLDGAARKLLRTPRYRAGGVLRSRYLGNLLSLALAPEGPRRAGQYPLQLGEPSSAEQRVCDTVVVPLPRGAWRLSFDRATAAPCVLEIETEGDEGSELQRLVVESFGPWAEPVSFALPVPDGVVVEEFTAGGPAIGAPAPAMALDLPGGGVWKLAEQRGRVVLLDFWATWCVPCRPSLLKVERLIAARPGAPLAAMACNVMDGGDRAAYIDGLEISYPWAVADAHAGEWGVDQTGVPVLFVVGKDGRLAEVFVGALDEKAGNLLAAVVDRELAR